ncbi:MAG: dihydroorotase [Chloroflexota bacterium]|jgi:dihydroorotase|nr:dihydroorotase [Chloroflexota bacterium]
MGPFGRLAIEGGLVWTPDGILTGATVLVEGERIAAILAGGEDVEADERIDARKRLVLPGLVDTHSHHREPGFTHKEDIAHATRAAAAGGVTTTIGMPNVDPPATTAERYASMMDLYRATAIVDFNVNPAPTMAEEVPKLAAAGALGFKVFQVVDTKRSYPHMPGLGVTDDGEMLEIFENVAATGLPVMVHPQNQALMSRFEQAVWARGEHGPLAYASAQRTHDGLVWNTAIMTLLQLQEVTGVRLHVLHMVTVQSLEMIRAAKLQGRAVTSEVNPFALFLGDLEIIEKNGPRALGRWVPAAVRQELWRGISDGSIDVLGTDHAPHTAEEKQHGWVDMWKAPSGVPQLQDYLTQLLEKGVRRGNITLDSAVRIASYNPARQFGLYPRKGTIEPGADADIVIVDSEMEIEFRDENALSRCGWTPYHGQRARGVPIHTLVRGRYVYRDRQVVGEPGWGRQARRDGGRQ